MFAWSFSARTIDEVARLLRALSKHRYVREIDFRIHWTVDRALAHRPTFAPHAAAFEALRAKDRELEVASRDPRNWREAMLADVTEALTVLWTPDEEGERARTNLAREVASTGLPPSEHEPFKADVESPPHPELILLDWELFPVDELDAERHAGAFAAMEDSGDEVDASAPIYQEGPILALPELVHGAPNGVLPEDFFVWSDGPYSYSDYVFRGVAKAAKLVDAPIGYRDL